MDPAYEWRQVVGFEGDYWVSNNGDIWTRRRSGSPGGLMAHKWNPQGYRTVILSRGGVQTTHTVHKLVMRAFVGPRPDGMEVRHLDGDRNNPRLSNLAYGTPSENMYDKRQHGTDHNVNKTHCPSGHPYDDENTYIAPSRPGARYCRACSREWQRAASKRAA